MFWGILLIAIGIGALLDIAIWPVVFIAIGAGLLLSRPAQGGRGIGRGFAPCSCWPFKFESQRERVSSSDQEQSRRMV